jgi:hypothetical protein
MSLGAYFVSVIPLVNTLIKKYFAMIYSDLIGRHMAAEGANDVSD